MLKPHLLEFLKKHPFVLAPMAGITGSAFRSYMRRMGCGLLCTELVSASGIRHQNARTQELMRFTADQHPVGIQIFGSSIEDMQYAASVCEQKGADFVDINLGCPVPKVVKKGAGSAGLKDLLFLQKLFRALKKTLQIPLSVKVRTGWCEHSRNTLQVAQLAYDEGLAWISVHGRTRAQQYKGLADWDYIRQVAARSPLPLIGNGDILTGEDAAQRLPGLLGVMIGRGALKDPWIFQSAHSVAPCAKNPLSALEILWEELEKHKTREPVRSLHIKKAASWYSKGYHDAGEFRKKLFSMSYENIMPFAKSYFDGRTAPAIQSHLADKFMLGGHG